MDESAGGLQPSPALAALGRALAGSWDLRGEASGRVRYEWAEGGLFLVQHVDIAVFGRPIRGMEFIGHLTRPGVPPSAEVWSRFYGFSNGLTLDYVYELQDRTLTIFFMRKGADNRFTGTFSEDFSSYSVAWAWPGGGYRVEARRVG